MHKKTLDRYISQIKNTYGHSQKAELAQLSLIYEKEEAKLKNKKEIEETLS